MVLKLAKTVWGVPDAMNPDRWEELFKRIADEGFSAIEANCLVTRLHPDKLVKVLAANGLSLIAQIHTTGGVLHPDGTYCYMSSRSVQDHVKDLRKQVAEMAKLKPVLINSHSGHDSWNTEECVEYLKEALNVEAEFGIPLLHESHRRRIFWNPYNARDILKTPGLGGVKVNADLSHWVCVCERAFNMEVDVNGVDDWWPETLELFAKHCWLIHARVGHAEGPQVPDPSAKEYQRVVAEHLKWWEVIWESMRERGIACWSEPEFGPSPYMQHLPHTDMPVADLWNVNKFIAGMLSTRYAEKY